MYRILILLATLLYSCQTSRPVSAETFFSQVLERENLADSNVLLLYIGEGMCSECINKELINLNENGDVAENTVIVGSFSNKRHFLAAVSSVTVKRKIFIPVQEMRKVEIIGPKQPHYTLHIGPSRSFETPYYPVDCTNERTLKYYKSVEELLPASRR